MKTAEEWEKHFMEHGFGYFREAVKQIQLDAMKDGMRRQKKLDVEIIEYHKSTAIVDKNGSARILNAINHIKSNTAAEQLTEKDL